MIRTFATTVSLLALAIAAPALGQTTHVGAGATVGATSSSIGPATVGIGGDLNGAAGARTIIAAHPAPASPAPASPVPLYHDGINTPGLPFADAANRANGTVGQQGISGVTGVRGVRAVGSGPINQHPGVDRP